MCCNIFDFRQRNGNCYEVKVGYDGGSGEKCYEAASIEHSLGNRSFDNGVKYSMLTGTNWHYYHSNI